MRQIIPAGFGFGGYGADDHLCYKRRMDHIAAGHQPCHRCGGRGRYHTYGRCFRCGGNGRDPEPMAKRGKRRDALMTELRAYRVAGALLASLRPGTDPWQVVSLIEPKQPVWMEPRA